jgi:hypothetical protein
MKVLFLFVLYGKIRMDKKVVPEKRRRFMTRWILILLMISILIFSGFVFFYNGISDLERLKIQQYNHKTESYEKGKVVSEKSSIKTFRRILNRARHETRTRYKMAYPDDCNTVTYQDQSKDTFLVWKSSGRYTHIIRTGRNDSFKISDEGNRRELMKLLK